VDSEIILLTRINELIAAGEALQTRCHAIPNSYQTPVITNPFLANAISEWTQRGRTILATDLNPSSLHRWDTPIYVSPDAAKNPSIAHYCTQLSVKLKTLREIAQEKMAVKTQSDKAETETQKDRHSTKTWSRGDKIALGIFVATLLGVVALLFVPEVRRFIGLEKDHPVIDHPIPAPQIKVEKRVVAQTASNISELRKQNQVTLIREAESDKTLSEIPAGAYGFAAGIDLTVHSLEDVRVGALQFPGDFEVEKLADSTALVVGYAGPETLDNVREGVASGQVITIYGVRWKEASNLVAIRAVQLKFTRVRHVDTQQSGKFYSVIALDCRAN
jgi:hypothetical protein